MHLLGDASKKSNYNFIINYIIFKINWVNYLYNILNREINKETNTITFAYSILKTYKKSDIIRILKLIEIPKIYRSKDNQHEIISLTYISIYINQIF